MKKAKKTLSNTIKRAKKVLVAQKNDYQRIFKAEVRKGGDSKKAAVRAGSIYRSRYGATRKARWNRALRDAKQSLF